MNELRIWICGAKGKIGKSLVPYFENKGYIVLASDIEVDISKIDAVFTYAERHRPDMIINCAAMTGFLNCEENELEAYKVNALGARNVAIVAQSIHAKLIHISSDDVFSGTQKQHLNEFDTPLPSTVYGKSKLAGESMIKEVNTKHIIVRSSWIYDMTSDNFLYHLFESVKANKEIGVSSQQYSSPTSIDTFMHLLHVLITSQEYGLFHASCEGECSRYEFACKALMFAGIDESLVKPSETHEYGQSGHIILDNLMLKMTDVDHMPTWDVELEHFIKKHGGAFV